jgi:hypothetical protein
MAKTLQKTLQLQNRKAQDWRSPADEWAAPLFWVLVTILAGAACVFLLLYSLGQPKINPNPGVAAYTPPPGTRLIPLPRKSDAPELAELPPAPASPSSLTALAQAQPTEQPAKHDVRPPIHKRPRAEPNDQPGLAQWNYGYRGGNNGWTNSGSNNRALSGGPKSWF